MSTLAFKSAVELARMVRQQQISALELTDYYIDRIEQHDQALNAVVVRDFQRARQAAQALDARGSGKADLPLAGVPMTVKESYAVAGLKTTWGFPMWRDMVAPADAVVVQKLRAAGAIILGKTNVPLMLGDFQTYNEIYGVTNNPWDTQRSPGGSSGGSAAALAAGLVGMEAGSDIGGSLRNPAHYCGIYAHKPTWGVVPIAGHQPPVAPPGNGVDLAVVGPMARSIEDIDMAMRLLPGPMPLQARGWQVNLPQAAQRPLKQLRVAFWHDQEQAPVDAEVANRSREVAAHLRRLGVQVDESRRPDLDMQAAMTSYVYLLQAVNTAGAPAPVYQQNLAAARSFAEDDDSQAALFARAAVASHREWQQQDSYRQQLRRIWNEFFADIDVLVCPISATPALQHDHSEPAQARTISVNGQPRPMFEQSFWAGMISVANLPSTVFPAGHAANGLPIGLQAVAAEFNDFECIEFAGLMAQEFGGFVPPPAFAGAPDA